jgi:maltodextrin utilization protein YvdJ
MAKGMNWGIMSLLAVIAVVLGCVTSFFVYLAKKSATVSAASAAASMAELPNRA